MSGSVWAWGVSYKLAAKLEMMNTRGWFTSIYQSHLLYFSLWWATGCVGRDPMPRIYGADVSLASVECSIWWKAWQPLHSNLRRCSYHGHEHGSMELDFWCKHPISQFSPVPNVQHPPEIHWLEMNTAQSCKTLGVDAYVLLQPVYQGVLFLFN